MSKQKYYSVTVTATAPADHLPQSLSITGVGITEKSDGQAFLESKAIDLYKNALAGKYPGVEFSYTATLSDLNPQFIIVDEKGKKGKAQSEPQEETGENPE